MHDGNRSTCVSVRPGELSDLGRIVDLWRSHGDKNVDVRESQAIEGALASAGLHVFEVDGFGLVATGGFYPYAGGAYTELGSSCWRPPFKSRGGALVSVAFRAIYASLAEIGTLVTSEVYPRGVKSLRVLERAGFERFDRMPRLVHQHAYSANPDEPVAHMVLSPWRMPALAKILLRVLDGEVAPRGDLTFRFAAAYNFDQSGIRAMVERLARGDVSMIGFCELEPVELASWVALRGADTLLDYSEFLREQSGGFAPQASFH